jgi:hypothetical protein
VSKIVLGAALCGSSLAFAAEPASSSMVLSEQQMDVVTAGTGNSSSRNTAINAISQRQGDSTNVSIAPTVGLNVAVLTLGNRQSVTGAKTTQSGGTQTAVIKN